MIKLLLGLGNPGRKYSSTRHNLGYRLVELLAKRSKRKFKYGKGSYIFTEVKIKRKKVILVKPQTFMNQSGIAAKDCLDDFSLSPEELLVLCDDMNLPLGKLRIRPKGADGGHNGLKSIISLLNTRDFARLRMGIGLPSPEIRAEDYVLQDFRSIEKDEVAKILKDASSAVETVIFQGITESMNRFN
ncbi:MAG TPA: aminoacyl-tRNA hydrolase [candidate division Zixibacteria bacterium]